MIKNRNDLSDLFTDVLGASSMHRSLQCTKAAGVGSLPESAQDIPRHFEVGFLGCSEISNHSLT